MRRRGFLSGLSSLAPLAATGLWDPRLALAAATPPGHDDHNGDDGDDDECGVASGDPAEDAVTLWTRVPRAARARSGVSRAGEGSVGETLAVRWTIAGRQGDVIDFLVMGESETSAVRDWTVKVRADGLRPGGRYVYWFEIGLGGSTWRSVEGSARTLPSADSELETLRVAYVSCQNYGLGYFNVLDALARDSSVDFCVHLGDSIYEDVPDAARFLQVRPEPVGTARTLDEYRARYLLSLRDVGLREARRAHTWISLPDDHEVYNDYWGTDVRPESTARRAAGMRAYFEYTPLDDALFPRLHRAFRFGRLATLFAIDERQYRDGPVCPSGPLKSQCDASRDASRTMLGAQQKSWLLGGLEGSGTTWNVLLSQVLMMPQILVDRPEGLERGVQEDLLPQHPLHDGADAAAKRKRARGDLHLTLDSFDGYPAERAELADALAARGRGNTLVWTGDIHNCYAGHLRTDANSVGSPEGFRAAFEMSTGSVSSIGAGDVFRFGAARLIEGHVKRANRHMSFLDLRHHMYVRVTIGREWARHETVCVDTTLRRRYRTFVGAALLVERGSLEVSREA